MVCACIAYPLHVPIWCERKQPDSLAICAMLYQPEDTAEYNAVTALPPSKVYIVLPFFFLILLSALTSFQASKSKDDRKCQRKKAELLCSLTRYFAK